MSGQRTTRTPSAARPADDRSEPARCCPGRPRTTCMWRRRGERMAPADGAGHDHCARRLAPPRARLTGCGAGYSYAPVRCPLPVAYRASRPTRSCGREPPRPRSPAAPHRPAASRHESVPQAGRACRRCRRKAMQPLRPDTRSRPTGEELEEKAGRGRPHLRTPAEKLEACGSPPRTLAALGLGARVACPQGRHASTDRRTASYRVLVAAIWQVPAVRHQRAVGGVGSNGVRTMAKSRRRQAGEGGIRPRPVRAF